ncbi:MAG: dethiobiotin synthase, partial [Muribaculaceae bacterium]|nr:dethiobiotin synthase [Muribaculaceae bacterium]
MNYPPILFITGIGTDVGKTYATGWLARTMMNEGLNVITQKFVQTGCTGFSEDIATHRRLMGIGPTSMDLDCTTAPQICSYPAAADLAARIDGKE